MAFDVALHQTPRPVAHLLVRHAKVVTARPGVQGWALPVFARMFYEAGAWHWSMTKENVAGCKK